MQPSYADQQQAAQAAIATSYDRLSARGTSFREEEDDEDDVVEQDPAGNFHSETRKIPISPRLL